MIGVLLVEWCYQALNPRARNEVQNDYQATSYENMRADYMAKANDVRKQIEVEDAKDGDDPTYDSALIYDLLAQEQEFLDLVDACQIGFMDSQLAKGGW